MGLFDFLKNTSKKNSHYEKQPIIKQETNIMTELQNLIKEDMLPKLKGPKGFSILHYNDPTNHTNYDVYFPTNDIENYYFFTYRNGKYFDLFSNEIPTLDVPYTIYRTEELISENFWKILNLKDIYIEEHDRLNYSDYQNPKETSAHKFKENGYKAFQEDNFSEAYDNYNQAVLLEPYKGSHYLSRASCFVKSRQYDVAIFDTCKALISNPISKQNVFIKALEGIAGIYSISKDFEKAIKMYSFIYKKTEKPWILEKRAKCYIESEKYELAIQDYETLINEERKIKILIELAEVVLKSGNENRAELLLNEVINFPIKNDEEWVMKMTEGMNKPYKDRAEKLLQKINNKKPIKMANYKPLEYRDSVMNVNEQRVMVARLNKCKEIEFGSMISYSHFSNCTHTITIDWDSPLATAIRNQINDQNNPYVKINLDDESKWVVLDDIYEGNPTKIYHSRFAKYL